MKTTIADTTSIEWTGTPRGDGTLTPGFTFNPWIGCQKVSAGCAHCYAETLMDHRYGKVKWGPAGTRVRTSAANWRKPLKWDREAWAEGVRRKVFCASLADVFEDRDELNPWRRDLARLVWETPNLDWLFLTKRPENAKQMSYEMWFPDAAWPKNYWVGTSVEDQRTADVRIPRLLEIPAAVRFLSVEPLLGPVDLRRGIYRGTHFLPAPALGTSLDGIDWCIVGAESGHGARPMELDWVRWVRDQCLSAKVAFFFKQKLENGRKISLPELDGRQWAEFPAPHAGASS